LGAYTTLPEAPLPEKSSTTIRPMMTISKIARIPATQAHGLVPDGSGSSSVSDDCVLRAGRRAGSGAYPLDWSSPDS
jgi:hypothetical protein